MAAHNTNNTLLAKRARELFTEQAVGSLPSLAQSLNERLVALQTQPGTARDIQDRREAWQAFESGSAMWVSGTSAAWRRAQSALASPLSMSGASMLETGKFELMDNEVMETRILASRFALRLLDFASWELNDLRLRIQNLEDISELRKDDILRPEILAKNLVDQWTKSRLSRDLWLLIQDVLHERLAQHLLEAYRATNAFLIRQGVMADIDLRPLVKRTPSAVALRRETGAPPAGTTAPGGRPTSQGGLSGGGHAAGNTGGLGGASGMGGMGDFGHAGGGSGTGMGGNAAWAVQQAAMVVAVVASAAVPIRVVRAADLALKALINHMTAEPRLP